MATTYYPFDPSQREFVMDVMVQYHGELAEAGVTLDLLFAYAERDEAGSPKGPAVTHGGYPALAVVRITPYKGRVKGLADAEIVFDGDAWKDKSVEERRAIVDHELQHLTLVVGEEGIEADDLSRPKLKLRKHDFHFGGFDVVAKRHGANAAESQAVAAVPEFIRQIYLPGFQESVA